MTQDELQKKLRAVFGKQLRRLFKYSGLRTAAKNLQPYCSECGSEEYLEVNHNPPIIPVDRAVPSPLEYFMRMFCFDTEGNIHLDKLEVLCEECHARETARQDAQRKIYGTGRFSSESRRKASETRKRRLEKRKKSKNRKGRKR